MDDLKSKVAQRKHDLSVKRAANYSELLDEDASFAIDYAAASIEQAKVAVFDARWATSRSKTPSAQPFDIRLGFGEIAARRSFFFACGILANVYFWST
jgi:hypothetical protein